MCGSLLRERRRNKARSDLAELEPPPRRAVELIKVAAVKFFRFG